MAKIYIDNKEYEVKDGQNLLEAVLSLGINLTYFCWHPAMGSVGACRQCAVMNYRDENDTRGRLVMACMTPVTDGMRISMKGDWSEEFRAGNIEALMLNHPHDCPTCDEGGECHLQDMTVMSGHNYRRTEFKKRTHHNQNLGPFIHHEMNRCIQCYRCVRFYNDYADGTDFSVFASHDSVYFGRTVEGTLESEFSGNLVEVCPTGVFTDKPLRKHYTRKWDLKSAPSICHGCSLGCNILVSERYGKTTRVLTRFNGDVNGYFLCDRGRFGFEYTNNKERILHPVKKKGNEQGYFKKMEALEEIRKVLKSGKKLIGIGSPRASLESNYALKRLVGKENFYGGVTNKEGKLTQLITDILKDGKVKTPPMKQAEDFDSVFIIGEDITNTAARLALSLRQTAKKRPNEERSSALRVRLWDDGSIKEGVQKTKGPVYIATTHQTKLTDIATKELYASPDEIARLAYAVTHEINPKSPEVKGLSKETTSLAKEIAKTLKESKKPLIVSGSSLYSEAIIEAAANVAYALKDINEETGLIYTVAEANTMGLSMLSDQYLEDAIDKVNNDTVLITLENDLFQRIEGDKVEKLFKDAGNSIVFDSLENATTKLGDYVIPAGTFSESTGTIVNNEGRAQRFYQAFKPDNDSLSSWAWISELEGRGEDYHFDQVVDDMIKEYADLKPVKETAPDANYRDDTQKIPRASHRYSGRTAMKANINVSEEKPPVDNDSPMSFTMEGFHGQNPSSLITRNWAPGWNSVQSINKQQIEVGGPLHDGNPGKRLFEPLENNKANNFSSVPKPFKADGNKKLAIPFYYIYGSEELSVKAPAVAERVPESKFTLNTEDAKEKGLADGDMVEINYNEYKINLKVKLNDSLAKGTIGIPKGFRETIGCTYPFWTELKKV